MGGKARRWWPSPQTHPYWHSHEYRHLLRGVSCYAQWKKLKSIPSQAWWDGKYLECFRAISDAGLDPSGFSLAHTEIIGKVLQIPGLVNSYHRKGAR